MVWFEKPCSAGAQIALLRLPAQGVLAAVAAELLALVAAGAQEPSGLMRQEAVRPGLRFAVMLLRAVLALGVLGYSGFRDLNGTLEQNFLGIELESLTEGM